MRRISVPIHDDRVRRALVNMADREMRDPRDQAAYLITEGLRQRGLLDGQTVTEGSGLEDLIDAGEEGE